MKSSFEQILTGIFTLLIGGFLSCGSDIPEKRSKEVFHEPQEKVIDDEQNSFSTYIVVDSVHDVAEIEQEVPPFNGRFFSSLSWNDKLGDNILIISESGAYEEGNGRKEIFVYHYVKRDSLYDVLWQMNDYVDGRGCDLDIQVINFFPLISDVDSMG